MTVATATRPCFATWLLEQRTRDDAIGRLAKAAAGDRAYPSQGDVRAVSQRLNQLGADPEMHEALEDAEIDFHAL